MMENDDVIKIILGAGGPPPDMMPGMHGKTKGSLAVPGTAEELLCQIKDMICEFLGSNDMPMDKKSDMDESIEGDDLDGL